MVKTHVEKTLKVNLTNDELLQAGNNLADSQEKLNSLEREKQNVNDCFKSKISEVEAQIGKYSNMILTKYEYRTIKCIKVHDYKKGIICVYREDTGEEVENRQMTEEEKQMDFIVSAEEENKKEDTIA